MKKMDELYRYALCYPQTKHPLAMEKDELKSKYIFLLKYYADKLYPDSDVMSVRLQTFKTSLFGDKEDSVDNKFDIKSVVGNVLKTRFTPFRLFSYRYLFLFDCLILLAPDNFEIGQKICDELKESVNSRYHKTLDTMVQQMYEGDSSFAYKKLISQDLVDAWNNIRSYVQSQNRNITFTATMSAGKSTLINAIIGQELSYAKKAACTATIMKFSSAPATNPLLNVYCDGEIKTLLTEQEVRELTKGREETCEIRGYFSSILSKKKITLIDTPGVNSSQNPKHKKITRNELIGEDTDILVYIIPVENYGSEGDYEHLTYIKKKVQYQNIMFVVNMMDSCDFEDDSVSEIVKNISEHLISIGFENPIICPMSAKAGMVFKQALKGIELSKNDKQACKTYVNMFSKEELALNTYYPVVVSEHSANGQLGCLDESSEKVWKAYVNTGLPGFERLLYDMTKEEK